MNLCADEGGSGTTPSASPSGTAGATASPTASPTASASAPSAAAASPESSPSAQGGDLAETGSSAPVGALSGVAAALLGTGGYLLFRRHKAGARG